MTTRGASIVYTYRWYIKDHLGSNCAVMDASGNLSNCKSYYPYGREMDMPPYANGSVPFEGIVPSGSSFSFSSKEFVSQGNVNWYDFGARWYDSYKIRWTTQDPLAEKYYGISPYVYCAGNPVNLVDPEGEEVVTIFDKETNKVYIVDLDYYQKGLPIKFVSANDYQMNGIRGRDGKLTHNQVLVLDNVFSGGMIDNGSIVRDRKDSRQVEIPNGTYDIVDNDADTRHSGWFRLDKHDSNTFNDKDDDTGRSGYRFHLGGLSWGCVTVDKNQENAQHSWDAVTTIFNTTSRYTVPEKRGWQWLNPFSRLTKYGTMVVKGVDKTPYKKTQK